jgi:hypothetical protein
LTHLNGAKNNLELVQLIPFIAIPDFVSNKLKEHFTEKKEDSDYVFFFFFSKENHLNREK